MNREELADLRRVVEAMTPAPWRWGRGGSADDNFFTVYGARHDSINRQRFVLKIDPSSGSGTLAADTDGIVALRNAAPYLLAAAEECERLRAEFAAVRAAAVEACDLAASAIRNAPPADSTDPGDEASSAAEIRARIGGGP